MRIIYDEKSATSSHYRQECEFLAMSLGRNPRAVQANPQRIFSRNDVALNEHVHQSTCSASASQHQKSFGAAAPAAALVLGAKATVQTVRESSSRCTSAGDCSTDWALNRRDRYKLQDIASKTINRIADWGRNRVGMCGRHKLAYGRDDVSLIHDITSNRAWLEGLALCDSPWLCAVCAARIGEQRADDVRRIENYARDKGHGMSLLTLTSHHTIETKLAELLTMQSEALKLFWSGRQAQAFKKQWGLIGFIRAFEVTHSASAGFHPHYHYLLVTERNLSEAERKQMSEELFARWVDCSLKVGLSKPSERGFDLRTGVTAGQYVSKWGLAREMSKQVSKVGRGHQSRNMWQVLAGADTSDADARIWVDYARATKGKAQQFWTKELKAILEAIREEEANEESESEGEENELDIVYLNEHELLDLYTTDVVNYNWCNLFELIEEFGLGYVRDYLRRRSEHGYQKQFFDGGREPFTFDDVDE
jgi:hypothetical protein